MPGGLGAMVPPVEAQSLASLNLLAANPPQYPVNPTEERQPPLTLYISRVPGTRDVILSPFKPQLKNVTGEDVANSLYYIHLELPSDELLPPAPIKDSDTPRSSRESSRTRNQNQNQIPRKPLPPNSKVSSRISLPRESSAGSGEQDVRPQTPQSERGAAGVAQTMSTTGSEEGRPALPPRPVTGIPTPPGFDVAPELPPRPVSQHQSPVGSASSPAARPRLLGPRPQPDARGGEHERMFPPTPEPSSEHSPTTRKTPSRSSSPTKLFDNFTPLAPFTLSIIRRDPSSRHQWNIGKVTSHQIESEDESGYVHQRPAWEPGPAAPPINIFIETSGYCKFRRMPMRQSFDRRQRDSASSLPWSLKEPAGGSSSPIENGFTGFTRQALMTYSKSWTSGIRDKFRRSESIDDTNAPRTHAREESTNSVESVEAPASSEVPITQPGHGLKPRGYMFMSPWDGRCEFRTGSAGRSVTCRHILPESSQTNSNPLAPGSSPPERIMAMAGAHPQISELRFSLPSKELLGSREEASQHLHGHFSRLFKHQPGGDASSDDDGVVSPFELSLGKEKAGGGNRGKRAKMGKLIVYDEGLKMLDLVVAANMGIWWGAWERTF